MASIVLEHLVEPNVYGYRLVCGSTCVEVVRCYAGQWAVFRFVNGASHRDGTGYVPFVDAMRIARAILAQSKLHDGETFA